MTTIAINKRAKFDYEILDRYEAGIILTGQEVKSAKTGHMSLKGSFVTLRGEELFLTNSMIPPYKFAGELSGYDPSHPRKLLLRKSQIRSLIGKVKSQGLTLIPLRVYTKKRLIKVEFAVAKGKRTVDKRHVIAEREAKRKIDRILKNS